jgi:hypothetical protein
MTYDVGERVGYKPPGGLIGVFTIIRRMPNEPRAYVLDKERIGVLREDVLESALTKLTPSPMASPTLWDKSGPRFSCS